MVTLKIASELREIRTAREIEESWISRQINGRRADSVKVCVQVTVQESNLDLVLSTPGCTGALGGGRSPNSYEREVFDLWAKLGLNDENFTAGNLIAFLHQLLKR